MILTLMLIILTAILVIVIIGFVMDRLEMAKLKSGMRTLNKRIKRLERVRHLNIDPPELAEMGRDFVAKMDKEDVTYEAVDTKNESATEEAGGDDLSAETDDNL